MGAFAGLYTSGGSGTVALSTTAALVSTWGDNLNGTYDFGDYSVRPDYANNRMLVAAVGQYKVEAILSGTMATGCDVIVQARKNGVAVANLKAKSHIGTTKGQVVLSGLLTVTTADNPKNIPTFANPTDSPNYIGAGGAPDFQVPVDLVVSCATGTDTFTVEEAQMTIMRLL